MRPRQPRLTGGLLSRLCSRWAPSLASLMLRSRSSSDPAVSTFQAGGLVSFCSPLSRQAPAQRLGNRPAFQAGELALSKGRRVVSF